MPRWGALIVLVAAAAAAAGFAFSRDAASAGDGGAGRGKRKAPRAKPFVVQSVAPRHGAKFVRLAADITLKFSAAVDPASLTTQNVVLRRLLEHETLDWSYRTKNGGRTVVLQPRLPFEPGADYELVVTRSVRGKGGSRLGRRKRAIFFTDPRFSPYVLLHPDMFEDLEATMNEPRAGHSATLVAGGGVLLAGGKTDAVLMCAGAELYDRGARTFRMLASPLTTPRAFHADAALPGGDAILIGGIDAAGNALASTEFYSGGSLRAGPAMAEPRDYVAAVTLQDGRVLVTGGLRYLSAGGAIYSETAELLDAAGSWRLTLGKPLRRRAGHTLTLLPDGTVLVVGGTTAYSGFSATAEIFDPATETFRTTANAPRNHRQLHNALAIDVTDPDAHHVLVADGGDPIVELYDDTGEQFIPAGGASFTNRTLATASLLPSGDVLFTGGFELRGTQTIILSSMDLYIRSAGAWGRVFSLGTAFSQPRAGHTATTLADDTVLFAGGFDQNGGPNLVTAVLLTPPAKTK